MALRSDGIRTKKRILKACVKLFLENGYRKTTMNLILSEASVSSSSFQNLFCCKEGVLLELENFMFKNQFKAARKVAGEGLPPVYVYQIFGPYQPALTERDFYELELGTAGLMRGFMGQPCTKEFTLERKLEKFLTLSLRGFKVPEEELQEVLAYLAGQDIRSIAQTVMEDLFRKLAMHYKFSLDGLLPPEKQTENT